MSGDERLGHEVLNGDIHLVVVKDALGTLTPLALEITNESKGKEPFLFTSTRFHSTTLNRLCQGFTFHNAQIRERLPLPYGLDLVTVLLLLAPYNAP